MPGAPVQPYAVAARELLRATLLDALREELRTTPWPDVTMARVARGAGVSRQTLYNEFGSRGELAQALVLREVDRFLESVETAVTLHVDSPVTALAAAFDVFFAAAGENPVVRALVAPDGSGDELLALVTTQGGPVLGRATERLAAFLAAGWPQLPTDDVRLLSEVVVRLAISLLTLPGDGPPVSGEDVARLLGPYVEQALGE
jgi:AcrR family transcriptional regulator